MSLSRTVRDTDYLTLLKKFCDEALHGLPGLEDKKVFGCDAFFAAGSIFALVWKDGRVAVRLQDEALFRQALAVPGAQPWEIAARAAVPDWVSLSEQDSENQALLKDWLEKAYHLAYNKQMAKQGVEREKSYKREKGIRNRQEHIPRDLEKLGRPGVKQAG